MEVYRMEKLRVGIAGLGYFGELHTIAFTSLPYVQVTRVCSKTELRAKEIASRFNIPSISTDYESFAKSDDVDIISVVTSGTDHHKVAIPALIHGKHVFLEKPIADTLEHAEAIVEASKRTSSKFMVGHICRFQPQYIHAKEIIDKSEIGQICTIQAYRNNHYTTFKPERKSNPLLGTSIHDIDLALWMTGSKVESSHGYKICSRSDNVNEYDSFTAIVRLENKTICTFSSSWLGRDSMPAGVDAMMKIIGTKAEINIYQPGHNYNLINDNSNSYFNIESSHNPIILKQSALMSEIEYFLNCVIENKDPKVVSPEDALNVMKAVEKIGKSCEVIRI
jgi:UDP-N-acetylglucosamine 3-dehydrogenase